MAETTITVTAKGPYLVQGPVSIKDSEGNTVEAPHETVALCRCGSSTRKPFCDGTHARTGFPDASTFGTPAPAA